MPVKAHIRRLLDDGEWTSAVYTCGESRVKVWKRHVPHYREARRILTPHFDRVYRSGGAAFVAFTAPVRSYTPGEAAQRAVEGRRDPWYVEIFGIERIEAVELYSFLDHLQFGEGNGADRERVAARRNAAKAVLEHIATLAPFGLTDLGKAVVGGRFLERPTARQSREVVRLAVNYSRKYFTCEHSEEELWATWEKAMTFSLGPL